MATLGATLAYDLLVDAESKFGVRPVVYEDDVHPYTDLILGRVDAVLLDYVLAERGVRRNPGLMNQPTRSALATTSGSRRHRTHRASRPDERDSSRP